MQPHASGRAWTADDLARLPDDGTRHELQAGLLLKEPLPMHPHARVQSRLVRILGAYVEQHGLGEVFGEMGFVLARNPDTVRGPDVSFIAKEHLATIGDGTRFIDQAPDLAVEILSPSNRPDEIHAKVADYLAAGSHLVWVVDPQNRNVTVYRALLAPRLLRAEELIEGGEVVRGISVKVGRIFGE